MAGAGGAPDDPPGGERHPVLGVGARCTGCAGGRRLLPVGRHRVSDAVAGRERGVGAVRAGDRRGRAVQVRDHPAGRLAHAARGPDGPPHRGPAGHGVRRAHLAPCVGRRRVAGPARRAARARGTDVGVRGAPAVLAARPVLPRTGRAAARLREGSRFHACGADAGRRASLRRFLGLPGHLLLRTHRAPGHARRLQTPGGLPAPGRHRRDHGLGAGAFPARRLGAGGVRRASAVRALRSGAGRASRLGHPGVRLRPPRGAQLPGRQRRVLVRGVPHRRAARGRGGLHALPGLLPRAGTVDAEPARWPGEPGRGGVPAGDERDRVPQGAGCGDHRRGVHGLGRGDPRDPSPRPERLRRPRLRAEVEHGLDARLAAVHAPRPGPPSAPPRRHDLLDGVRLQRELSAADLARRGGARQGLAGVEDARRLVAAACQPAGLPGVHVGPSGQAAAVHGPGVRTGLRVVGDPRPGLVAAGPVVRRGRRPPGCAGPGARCEHGVPGDARPVGAGRAPRRFPVGRRGRRGRQRAGVPAPRRPGRAAAGGVELLRRAPPRLPHRCPGRRARLDGGPEHRRGPLRRQRPGAPRTGGAGAAGAARPPREHPAHPAPAGHGVAATGAGRRHPVRPPSRRPVQARASASAVGSSPVCTMPSRCVARVRATYRSLVP